MNPQKYYIKMFDELLELFLKTRGTKREANKRLLRNNFVSVVSEAIHVEDRLRRQKIDLKKEVFRLKEEMDDKIYESCLKNQHIIDDLRTELHELKRSTTVVESNGVLARTNPCNLIKAP